MRRQFPFSPSHQSTSLLLLFHYPLPSGARRCPVSLLTFDSSHCLKGCALCPLPFDLSEIYLYNCPCHYQTHIRAGGGWSLPGNLVALCSSILLGAGTTGLQPPPPTPTIPYCISLHVSVIDGTLEIFYWSVTTFDWGNANTNSLKTSYWRGYIYDQMANWSIDLEWVETMTVWIWTPRGHRCFLHFACVGSIGENTYRAP